MYYLSKLMGLAPMSLAYTHDKQVRVAVTLKTSVPLVLYTVLLIIGIAAALCFVLMFYRFDTLPFGTEQTNQVLVSEFVVSGITCVVSLSIGLTRIRKEMDSLLHKVSLIETFLRTKKYILRSNEICMWMQVTSLVFVLFIVYANDFVCVNYDINIGLPATILYFCNFIRSVTIMQFVNLVTLLKQKFQILNSYLGSAENPNQRRTDNNLWETLLKITGFRIEEK